MRRMIAVILGALTACALAAVMWPVLRHNHHLGGIEQAHARIAHPASTRLLGLGKVAKVGLLWGNGNHCDYFVGEARSTREPWEAIAAHYREATAGLPVKADVKELREDAPGRDLVGLSLPYDLDAPSDWSVAGAPPGEWIYVVYVADPSHDPDGDFRCH